MRLRPERPIISARARAGRDPPGSRLPHCVGRPACVEDQVRALTRKVRLHVGLVGVVVKEPAEDVRNKAGCYSLVVIMALIAGLLATFGLAAPEKDELNIAITADR